MGTQHSWASSDPKARCHTKQHQVGRSYNGRSHRNRHPNIWFYYNYDPLPCIGTIRDIRLNQKAKARTHSNQKKKSTPKLRHNS